MAGSRSVDSRVGQCRRLCVALTLFTLAFLTAYQAAEARQPFKILHVMSYHASWRWNDDQLQGFRAGLGDLPVDIRVFEMDTKRHNGPEWMQRVGAEARRQIDEWKPDLLYANDDNAQKHVATAYLDTDLPIVFSGVNAPPEDYGFVQARNVTGVLEEEHSAQSITLLRQIVPAVSRIAVIYDDDPTWPGVIARMRRNIAEIPQVEVVSWDLVRTFDDYKRKVLAYHGTVDALGLLGVFTFKDASGGNVPYQEVLRWTAEHSRLPDFSLWRDRPDLGTLCAVTVSGFQQGRLAGEMARSILLKEKDPKDIPMTRTARGIPVVSLARAVRLGINIPAPVLLSSHVVTDFLWER